jgi:hypothetical protein
MFKTFRILKFGYWDLPFDVAQDREPVERLVEPFVIWDLGFVIWVYDWITLTPKTLLI